MLFYSVCFSFRSESPNDIDSRGPGRGGRGKRGRQTMNSTGGRGRSTRSNTNPHLSANSVFAIPQSPIKCEKRRAAPAEEVPPAKRTRSGCSTPGAEPVIGEEGFIECPEPNCGKKYRHINGLKYHQSHAHKDVMLKLQNGEDIMDAEEEVVPVSSGKDVNNEDNVDTIVKKEKKKKNRDGKKKKGKKNSGLNSEQAHISHEEDMNSSKSEDNSKSVSFKQPTVQLTPVSVAKTVTAPIATVPVASSNMLQSELKSKKSKDKSDKKAKSEQSEDCIKESKQEKKAKKKKKDKNREKHHEQKQHSEKQDNSNKDIKPVIMDMVQTSPPKPASTVERNDSTDSQQPMNLSNKLEVPLLPASLATPEKPPHAVQETVQSPAYSDISDDGNDEPMDTSNKDRVEKKEDVNKIPSAVPSAPVGYGQPPSLTPVFSPSSHHHPQHSIINLTTKDKAPESSDSNTPSKDTQPKEGAQADSKPPGTDKLFGIPPQYGYPPNFPYTMDPAAYAMYNSSVEEHKRKQQQEMDLKKHKDAQDAKSLSPHPRSSDDRKMDKTPTRLPDAPRTDLQARDMSRATEQSLIDHERNLLADCRRRLETVPPEQRSQYEKEYRRHIYYEMEGLRQRERKIAAAAAAQGHLPSTPSSSNNHEVKKERLHSPVPSSARPEPNRTLEERLRAPEDRIRSEDKVLSSPSPRRTPTPSSKENNTNTPRSTPTSSYSSAHPYYSPHQYPPGMYPPPPHPFMAYPPGYHPAAAQDGKALEMLQQHASQIQQQQHSERVREQEQRSQGSPSTSRHLLPGYPTHPSMFIPGIYMI